MSKQNGQNSKGETQEGQNLIKADQPRNTELKCGIIMPIADNPDLGYPLGHWSQVRDIVIDAAEQAGFTADMVSNDTQVDLIHATIIKNIYANDVAVCDVSSRNANVMFELGLRIASKKPVILIKDDVTPFSFDTQLIPHLAYRRDLRHFETIDFQRQLKDKIATAHNEAQQPGYKSFLEQFTSYTLAQIDEQQVGVPEYLLRVANQMQSLEDTVKYLSTRISPNIYSQQIGRGIRAGQQEASHSFDKDINKLIESFLKTYKLDIYPVNLDEKQINMLLSHLKNSSLQSSKNMTEIGLKTYVLNYLDDRSPF